MNRNDGPEDSSLAERCLTGGLRGDRAAARVSQRGMRHAFLGRRAGADQPVLGLEEHMHSLRHEVCDQRRNSDAQIHQHARRKLPCDPTRDDDLGLHSILVSLQ
jgi:hypothetical protein